MTPLKNVWNRRVEKVNHISYWALNPPESKVVKVLFFKTQRRYVCIGLEEYIWADGKTEQEAWNSFIYKQQNWALWEWCAPPAPPVYWQLYNEYVWAEYVRKSEGEEAYKQFIEGKVSA